LYDVVEIDAASKSRVEDIRSIIEEVVYAPSIGKRKVYIIDEVQMMTNNAFNALLKTLEEPPEYVVFILATTEAQKIPATILSRCQRFDFKRLPVSVITSRLEQVAKQESITLDPQAAEMIALLADGAMRDALSILEQCQTAETVTRQTVLETVGIAGADEMLALIRACADRNIKSAISVLDRFYSTSKRMDTLLSELIGCYRDLLLIRMDAQECVRRSKDE
jgi:DNA polymerase-3 subunit gamma/tau